ncbi:uncharacterized protein LOC132703728 [Cylas formicarius]|uniref:uncharacterized protein LOC132703728 n=1 Tax=Cylas formicarius TaxID=197179 RepID=UPI002958892B|nr:uncharacterized protein LOC132703728 [Cylas formicarius]
MYLKYLVVATLVAIVKSEKSSVVYRAVAVLQKCLASKYPLVCLKERAVDSLNRRILSEEPITLGFFRIEKNRDYNWNFTFKDDLPRDLSKRSTKLSNVLASKISEFINSRTIRFDLGDTFEGRGKGGKGGGLKDGGKGVMMAAACMGAGAMVGKMGMMAAGAMMMSKLSLLMSLLMVLKKMAGGGGGGEEKEKQIKIVYAATGGGNGGGGDYGKGGGGGGWHRSLNYEPHIAYRGHAPENPNVVYEGY